MRIPLKQLKVSRYDSNYPLRLDNVDKFPGERELTRFYVFDGDAMISIGVDDLDANFGVFDVFKAIWRSLKPKSWKRITKEDIERSKQLELGLIDG